MRLSMATILLLILLSSSTQLPLSSAHNPWDYIHNLTGCHSGETREGLAGLKHYLNQFGYLLTDSDSTSFNFTDDFDADLEDALREYQRTFHLNETGTLDSATADLMSQPRCGVPDHGPNSSHPSALRGRGLYSYFRGAPRWDRRGLTYFLRQGGSADPATRPVLKAVFTRAFARWAEVTPLTFSEAESEDSADMVLGFHRGRHGDGEPFDGQLGTLAHAFSPTDGRLHFDADEEWVASADENGDFAALRGSVSAVDLESVALHEIGHLLGLGHSDVEGSVMFPTLRSGTRKVSLETDDVNGIQSLYGRNPNNRLGSGTFVRSPPSMTEERGVGSSAAPGRGSSFRWGLVGLVPVWVGALLVL